MSINAPWKKRPYLETMKATRRRHVLRFTDARDSHIALQGRLDGDGIEPFLAGDFCSRNPQSTIQG